MARVLLLGGLDPSGGAGITLDATVVSVLGGDALPIALANTVQGLRGFQRSLPVEPGLVREQLATVLADGPVDAVKVGYVGSAEQVVAVAQALQPLRDVPIVVDPVLSATTGGMHTANELVAAYREHLVPFAWLVTPNAPELAVLAEGRAQSLLELGVQAVLHKGGHGDGPDAIDELWQREGAAAEPCARFVRPRFDCGPVRGTGCALASAIATDLAHGRSMRDACQASGDWLSALLARVKRSSTAVPSRLPFGA